MFKEFFKKHISIIESDEAVLDAMSDTVTEGMGLLLTNYAKYTDEEYIEVGKQHFNSTYFTNSIYLELGKLIVNRVEGDAFAAFLEIIGLTKYAYMPIDTSTPVLVGNLGNSTRSLLTDSDDSLVWLKDELRYTDYVRNLGKVDMFINADNQTLEFNTVLKNASSPKLIALIQKGISLFFSGKFVMLNTGPDIIGETVSILGNTTTIVGLNYTKEFPVGYIPADGRTLSISEHYEGGTFDFTTSTGHVHDIPTSTNNYYYLGFFTDYLGSSLYFDVTGIDDDIQIIADLLQRKKHFLKTLVIGGTFTDAEHTPYKIPVSAYKLERYVNKSENVYSILNSVLIKYIDVSESLIPNTQLQENIDWAIDRNVFNTVLKVTAEQLAAVNFVHLLDTLNWSISYTGLLLGYDVGTVLRLPNNNDPNWINVGGTISVYNAPILWYAIRTTYGQEYINNGNYNSARFTIPPAFDRDKYIYIGTADENETTVLSFTESTLPIGLRINKKFTQDFPNLVEINMPVILPNLVGDPIILELGDNLDLDILDLGNTADIIYSDDPSRFNGSMYNKLTVSGQRKVVSGRIDGVELSGLPLIYLAHALLRHNEDMTYVEFRDFTLNNETLNFDMLTYAAPTNTGYTEITEFVLENSDISVFPNTLDTEFFKKVSIDYIRVRSCNMLKFVLGSDYNLQAAISEVTIESSTIDTLELVFAGDTRIDQLDLNYENYFGVFLLDNLWLGSLNVPINVTTSVIIKNCPYLSNMVFEYTTYPKLYLDNNRATDIDLKNIEVGDLHIVGKTRITRIQNIEETVLVKLYVDDCGLLPVDFSQAVLLEELTLINCNLSSAFTLPIINTVLISVDVTNNPNLQDLNIENKVALTTLYIEGTSIDDLNNSNAPLFKFLYAEGVVFQVAEVEGIFQNFVNHEQLSGHVDMQYYGTINATLAQYVVDLQDRDWTIILNSA